MDKHSIWSHTQHTAPCRSIIGPLKNRPAAQAQEPAVARTPDHSLHRPTYFVLPDSCCTALTRDLYKPPTTKLKEVTIFHSRLATLYSLSLTNWYTVADPIPTPQAWTMADVRPASQGLSGPPNPLGTSYLPILICQQEDSANLRDVAPA